MTTNLPQDVIDLVVEHAENGNWPEFDAAIELLRSQRQQGAEPVPIYQYTENELGGGFVQWNDCKESTMKAMAEKGIRTRIVYTTPPQANALVAAAKALIPKWYQRDEIVTILKRMKYSVEIQEELADWMTRHLQYAFSKGFQKGYFAQHGERPPIPADAEAALREVCMKVARIVENTGLGHSESDLSAIVNSVLGEGGK